MKILSRSFIGFYCRIPPNSPKAKSTTMSGNGSDESADGNPCAARSHTPQQCFKEDSSLKSCMGSSELAHVSLPPGPDGSQQMGMVITPTHPITESLSPLKEKPRVSGDQYIAELAPSSDLLTDKELQVNSHFHSKSLEYQY